MTNGSNIPGVGWLRRYVYICENML